MPHSHYEPNIPCKVVIIRIKLGKMPSFELIRTPKNQDEKILCSENKHANTLCHSFIQHLNAVTYY